MARGLAPWVRGAPAGWRRTRESPTRPRGARWGWCLRAVGSLTCCCGPSGGRRHKWDVGAVGVAGAKEGDWPLPETEVSSWRLRPRTSQIYRVDDGYTSAALRRWAGLLYCRRELAQSTEGRCWARGGYSDHALARLRDEELRDGRRLLVAASRACVRGDRRSPRSFGFGTTIESVALCGLLAFFFFVVVVASMRVWCAAMECHGRHVQQRNGKQAGSS